MRATVPSFLNMPSWLPQEQLYVIISTGCKTVQASTVFTFLVSLLSVWQFSCTVSVKYPLIALHPRRRVSLVAVLSSHCFQTSSIFLIVCCLFFEVFSKEAPRLSILPLVVRLRMISLHKNLTAVRRRHHLKEFTLLTKQI